MNQVNWNKIFTHLVFRQLIALWLFLLSFQCVQLPTEIPLPELNASIRFIQTDPDAQESGIMVDGVLEATLSYGSASEYMTFPAGNRILQLAEEVPETLFVDTDFKGTVFCVPQQDTMQVHFIKNKEGWIYSDPPADHLTKIHVAQMTHDTLYVSVQGIAPWIMQRGTCRSATITGGLIEIVLSSATAVIDTLAQNFSGGSSSTVVLMGDAADPDVHVYENK